VLERYKGASQFEDRMHKMEAYETLGSNHFRAKSLSSGGIMPIPRKTWRMMLVWPCKHALCNHQSLPFQPFTFGIDGIKHGNGAPTFLAGRYCLGELYIGGEKLTSENTALEVLRESPMTGFQITSFDALCNDIGALVRSNCAVGHEC
jgi:hypothetical protein